MRATVVRDPVAASLANISLHMWLWCHQRGFGGSVKISRHRSGSLTRYLRTQGFCIRLSDHEHNNTEAFDHQIIVDSRNYEAKLLEAMELLQKLLVGGAAAAAA